VRSAGGGSAPPEPCNTCRRHKTPKGTTPHHYFLWGWSLPLWVEGCSARCYPWGESDLVGRSRFGGRNWWDSTYERGDEKHIRARAKSRNVSEEFCSYWNRGDVGSLSPNREERGRTFNSRRNDHHAEGANIFAMGQKCRKAGAREESHLQAFPCGGGGGVERGTVHRGQAAISSQKRMYCQRKINPRR